MFFDNLNHNVVIWSIAKPSDHYLAKAKSMLPEKEQQKSARFKNTDHGAWWSYVHLAMRNVLGKYLGCDRNDVCFEYSKNKKPVLASEHEPAIFFNLTHCSNLALLAVTQCAEVGVDVENIKNISDVNIVAKHFFSLVEQKHMESFSAPKKRTTAFYEIWTQKESVIKANGGGLSLPLNAFDVIGTTTKNWKNIKPRSHSFGSKEYMTREISLSEFGLSNTHKAALSLDKNAVKVTPAIKMLAYPPEHFNN